jgi:hypothetical protein
MCDLELNYLCTYKLITEDDDDEKGLSEMMYQIQYLQMFGLTEFDENVIGEKLDILYTRMENERFLEEFFANHPYSGQMCKPLMFRTLFSYDYMDLFHKVLYNYFSNDKDNNKGLDNSIERLKCHMKSINDKLEDNKNI